MKTKSFKKYLEQRLDKDEIAEIEEQARLEVRILRAIQEAVSSAMAEWGELFTLPRRKS
jgi:hypothetical protein